ncbi:MAG: hypothetical protein A2X68_01035 [Ignavibacteria bacterium GWC2_56_12]|nr:MAG: hypothetical protein A2X68_01035 [Ignavibacteria bacterium GWC2_56_12]
MKYSSLIGHTVEVLGDIQSSEQAADTIIGAFFRARKYLGSKDRRFVAEATYGTLRHLRRCDHAIQSAAVPHENTTREGKLLLEVAAYLLVIEGRTDIAVKDFQELVDQDEEKERMGGVLSSLMAVRDTPADESAVPAGIRWSFPEWMVERFRRDFGDDAELLLSSLNEPPPLCVRVNTLKTNVDECRARLMAEGVSTEVSPISPLGLVIAKRVNMFALETFKEGWFEVQDDGSQVLPILIDPKPSAKVLDACAGAGGKTLEFAALMKNRGEIVATDVHTNRLEELRRRTRRAGASNVRVKEVSSVADLAPDHTGWFDVVLVDAPCSGVGTIRRNPGMKWKVTERTVNELAVKQREILRQSAPMVKPGGLLTYATCTLFCEENEAVVNGFLEAHPEFTLEDPATRLERAHLSGASSGRFVKLLPHLHGTDGFFCAFLRRAPRITTPSPETASSI